MNKKRKGAAKSSLQNIMLYIALSHEQTSPKMSKVVSKIVNEKMIFVGQVLFFMGVGKFTNSQTVIYINQWQIRREQFLDLFAAKA